jgi:hypothetical protein
VSLNSSSSVRLIAAQQHRGRAVFSLFTGSLQLAFLFDGLGLPFRRLARFCKSISSEESLSFISFRRRLGPFLIDYDICEHLVGFTALQPAL